MTARSPAENPPDPNTTSVDVAEAVRSACLDAALHAYEDARIRGLCEEGAWEAAVGAIRSVDLSQVIRRAKSMGGSDI